MTFMIGQPCGHIASWSIFKIVVNITDVTIEKFNEVPVIEKGIFSTNQWKKCGLSSPTQDV